MSAPLQATQLVCTFDWAQDLKPEQNFSETKQGYSIFQSFVQCWVIC